MDASDKSGFKIWAVDNVVYGPVDLPTLIAWVEEERILRDTWIYCEALDQWRKAMEVPELKMYYGGDGVGTTSVTRASDATVQSMGAPNLKPGALRRVKIFAALTDEQISRFIKFMQVRVVKQFASVVRQNEPGDAMYLLLDGEVRVRLMVNERETILTTLQAGDFFGEISLFDNGPRSADVVANHDTTLVCISTANFLHVTEYAPDLAAPFLMAMGKTMTARIRMDNKRLRDSLAMSRAAGR